MCSHLCQGQPGEASPAHALPSPSRVYLCPCLLLWAGRQARGGAGHMLALPSFSDPSWEERSWGGLLSSRAGRPLRPNLVGSPFSHSAVRPPTDAGVSDRVVMDSSRVSWLPTIACAVGLLKHRRRGHEEVAGRGPWSWQPHVLHRMSPTLGVPGGAGPDHLLHRRLQRLHLRLWPDRGWQDVHDGGGCPLHGAGVQSEDPPPLPPCCASLRLHGHLGAGPHVTLLAVRHKPNMVPVGIGAGEVCWQQLLASEGSWPGLRVQGRSLRESLRTGLILLKHIYWAAPVWHSM